MFVVLHTQMARLAVSLTGQCAARLYVLADLQSSVAPLAPAACNDDFCGYLSQLTVRPRMGMHRGHSCHGCKQACTGIMGHVQLL